MWDTRIAILVLLSVALFSKEAMADSPLYYGFFFPETTATSITNITVNRLSSLMRQSPEFKEFIDNLVTHYELPDANSLYPKPKDPNTGGHDPYYHVTTQYCGPNGDLCPGYYEQVHDLIGTHFDTSMVGFVYTNRTYGIRVNLTEEQKILFSNTRNNKDTFEGKNTSDFPGIRFEDQPANFTTDTRAHVTVGCAPNVPAVTTGPDLLQVIAFENDPDVDRSSWVVDEGNFVMYRDGDEKVFVLYPHQKMVADTTFEPYLNPRNETDNNSGYATVMSTSAFLTTSLSFLLLV